MQKVRRYQVSFDFLFLLYFFCSFFKKQIKTQQTPTVCSCQVSVSFSIPSWGSISPFPHGTCSLSVRTAFLGLEGGPPVFRQNLCSALLSGSLCILIVNVPTGLSPSLAPLSREFSIPSLFLILSYLFGEGVVPLVPLVFGVFGVFTVFGVFL